MTDDEFMDDMLGRTPKPRLTSYNQSVKEMRDKGIISTKEMVEMQTEALANANREIAARNNATPAREASNLGTMKEQLSFDLVNVNTLEAEIKMLRDKAMNRDAVLGNYEGHAKHDRRLLKEQKGLLRQCYRAMTPGHFVKPGASEELRNDLLNELLKRGLT